jgi:hypothetical protein
MRLPHLIEKKLWGPNPQTIQYLCDRIGDRTYPHYDPRTMGLLAIPVHCNNVDVLLGETASASRSLINRVVHIADKGFQSQPTDVGLNKFFQTRNRIALHPKDIAPLYLEKVNEFLKMFNLFIVKETDPTLVSYYQRVFQPLFTDIYVFGQALLELTERER